MLMLGSTQTKRSCVMAAIKFLEGNSLSICIIFMSWIGFIYGVLITKAVSLVSVQNFDIFSTTRYITYEMKAKQPSVVENLVAA